MLYRSDRSVLGGAGAAFGQLTSACQSIPWEGERREETRAITIGPKQIKEKEKYQKKVRYKKKIYIYIMDFCATKNAQAERYTSNTQIQELWHVQYDWLKVKNEKPKFKCFLGEIVKKKIN